MDITKSIDLRGIRCPMNFVKIKLALNDIKSTQTLEVYLDDGEPIESVPISVESEGNEIIDKKYINNYWILLIKKA